MRRKRKMCIRDRGENVHEQVLKYIPDYVEETVRAAVNVDDMPELWNETELNAALETKLLPEGTNYVTREKLTKWDYELAIKKITNKTIKEYEKKIEDIKAAGIDFYDVERRVLLMNVDRNWIDPVSYTHLRVIATETAPFLYGPSLSGKGRTRKVRDNRKFLCKKGVPNGAPFPIARVSRTKTRFSA